MAIRDTSGLPRSRSARFEAYLRTGRRVAATKAIEVKFNPWHDPEDGRFTFANGGRHFPGSSPRQSDNQSQYSPKNPRNHSTYVVRRGDTLSRIAAARKGLRISDLAELNGISATETLRPGQRLIVPNQAYLDAGRRAKNNFVNLAFYMDTHGGRLPPNPARAPTIGEQLDSDWRRVAKNGYEFSIDIIDRPRRIRGVLSVAVTTERSRRNQAQAGGSERRSTDDGGHFIAARFNGPRDRFNHFAQNANFNRGAYRAIEENWSREIKAGRRVFVDIVPQYSGASTRPHTIIVTWYVDGQRSRRRLPNEKKGH